jgi:hypothetical protein
MHTLRLQDRDASMTNLVSFHNVPMPRGLAFVIRDIERHGAPIAIFSADRTIEAIRAHNTQFGTNLHAQQWLVNEFATGRGNPANPVNQTSHCYHADATIGRLLGVGIGATIPWWALGLDIADRGKVEDVRRFMNVAHLLNYPFRQPYTAGSERHHVILTASPIANLEARKQIGKDRRA